MAVESILLDLTNGKPFIFVLVPFSEEGMRAFEEIERVVALELPGFVCLHGKKLGTGGHDLLQKIHTLVNRAELVIGVLDKDASSCFNPNVLYEVGYGVGRGLAPLLVAEREEEVPTDLKGLEVVLRKERRDDGEPFEHRLAMHLRTRLGTSRAMLRDMLQADNEAPVYIVASPRYPEGTSRIDGQQYDRVTFGDNVGIRGLLAAFGAILGETAPVELVSAQYCVPDLQSRSINLYLIGSGRANPLTPILLDTLQQGREPLWSFERDPELGRGLVLLRQERGVRRSVPGERAVLEDGAAEVHVADYGVVLRGPHPHHPDRTVLIMAGAHSLGTAAACFAATRSPLIRDIRDRLGPDFDLANRDQTIWALVRGRANDSGMLDARGVEVVEAGRY